VFLHSRWSENSPNTTNVSFSFGHNWTAVSYNPDEAGVKQTPSRRSTVLRGPKLLKIQLVYLKIQLFIKNNRKPNDCIKKHIFDKTKKRRRPIASTQKHSKSRFVYTHSEYFATGALRGYAFSKDIRRVSTLPICHAHLRRYASFLAEVYL
jgi:hypothetical protein